MIDEAATAGHDAVTSLDAALLMASSPSNEKEFRRERRNAVVGGSEMPQKFGGKRFRRTSTNDQPIVLGLSAINDDVIAQPGIFQLRTKVADGLLNRCLFDHPIRSPHIIHQGIERQGGAIGDILLFVGMSFG